MEIILYQQQLKKGSKIIITEKKLQKFIKESYTFKQKILENYLLKFHLEFIKKTSKFNCCNWNKWKIICYRFLLSNT